jgi:hypothetical protein
MSYADPADNARSVAAAAKALARAVNAGGDVESAARRLEQDARQALETPAFTVEEVLSEEDLLAMALAQLSIGNALAQAEHTLVTRKETARLDSASASLAATADLLENLDAPPVGILSDDASSQTALQSGVSTLDTMATSAAEVVTATFNKLLEKVPNDLRARLDGDLPGKIAGLALRAVRAGFDLLQRLVSVDSIQRIRADIDDVIARLGHGEDTIVLAGWAIGATSVRLGLAEPANGSAAELKRQLDDLTARYAKLCKLLRRVALVIAGLGGTLALIHVTLPHAAAVTVVGLVLVLGATILLGRDYTGANDLPGPIHGVRLLFMPR